jgi:hypothetical protein
MCCFAWLAALALLLVLGLLMLEERVVMCCFPWLGAGNGGHECLLELQESLSIPRLLAAVLGTFLFWNAGVLSESTPFRWAASCRFCGGSTAATSVGEAQLLLSPPPGLAGFAACVACLPCRH